MGFLFFSKCRILLIIFFFVNQCNFSQKKVSSAEDSIEKKISIDGIERRYLVYVPKVQLSSEEKIPMVVMLHGRFGTAERMLEFYKMNLIANREKFIVLYPDGFQKSWADGRGGNSPADKHKIDDVKFLETIILQTSDAFPVDKTKIFIAGHSNGGFMTQRMLIEKTYLFRAGVSVMSQLSKNVMESNSPTKSVSVAIIAGTEDPLVPYHGGFVQDGSEILGAEDSVSRWVEWNQCNLKPTTQTIDEKKDDTKLEIYSHSNCKDKTNVKLYKVIGAGHNWPGVTLKIPFVPLGRNTEELDASEEVWNFFKNQS